MEPEKEPIAYSFYPKEAKEILLEALERRKSEAENKGIWWDVEEASNGEPYWNIVGTLLEELKD